MEILGLVAGVATMVVGVVGVLVGVAATFGPASRNFAEPMLLVAAGAGMILVGRWLAQ